MDKCKFYTHYNPPASPQLKFVKASLTRQEFVQEADINNIMKRYAAGMPLPVGRRVPMFDDFSNVPDFQTSFEIVEKASEAFASLPSEVRRRFDNDPRSLLAFLQDESNREEAIRLGLIEKPATKAVEPNQPDLPLSVPETKVEGEGK